MPTSKALDVYLKRAYDGAAGSDGTRVLVDRLWPRGVSKAAAGIDHWFRDIAPSTQLRQWFGHDPRRWLEFRRRYTAQLHEQRETLDELRALAAYGPLTLIYAARDIEHNHALVLREALLGAGPRASARRRAPASSASSHLRRRSKARR